MQIDSDPDSDTYGQLLVEDMNDIDVFNARNELNQKMADIKELAQLTDEGEDYEENCNKLLSELVTACGEGSCSNPNEYSFQLSVNEVCQAVDTPIKFGIEAMVRKGLVWRMFCVILLLPVTSESASFLLLQGKFFDFRNFAIRREKIVFVTSEIYNGALGGLAGADAKCQERADVARRSGTFKAWLSDRTASVEDRFDRSRDGAAFVRTDGVRVANN